MFSARYRFVALLFLAALLPARIFAQNVPPVVSASIPDATLYKGAPPALISLNGYFNDPDTTGVRIATIMGNIDVALYDQQTPLTVANFKNYIDSGRYYPIDPTTHQVAPVFFHRSVAGFVIQTGGFVGTVNPDDPTHILPTSVLTFPSIQNEPGISNTYGTIAMAKVDGYPDSATSQWYINLADNGGPPNNLDTNNGGFTVFGRVIHDGMTVAEAISLLPRYNFGAPFDRIPLINYVAPDVVPENLITIPSISYIPSLTFTASSAQPGLATVKVSGTNLLVTPKAIGNATITVTATDVDGAQISQAFVVTMIANPVHLANISTRALVGDQDAALIGGFIVRGDTPKQVVVRAIGPSLTGVGTTLANPSLELHDGTGALIASNDNWQDAANAQDLIDLGLAPTEPNESAILTTIPANSTGLAYTAVVQGPAGSSGIALVEVYDLDSGPGASVLNISTRSDVQGGDNVLIGGLIVSGNGSQQVLVRAIGPSLAGSVTDPLADPTLTLYDAQGVQLDFNDNWQDNPAVPEIEASMLAPNDPNESAVLPTLAPGGYTAIVRGAGTSTGTGLVEVYVLEAAQ
ncbi:MAG TPA: peptidylprolyl isomerase [Chthoniobacterales bacterium]